MCEGLMGAERPKGWASRDYHVCSHCPKAQSERRLQVEAPALVFHRLVQNDSELIRGSVTNGHVVQTPQDLTVTVCYDSTCTQCTARKELLVTEYGKGNACTSQVIKPHGQYCAGIGSPGVLISVGAVAMACRREAQCLGAANSYACYVDSITEAVQECYWSGAPERSASRYIAHSGIAATAPTHDSWQVEAAEAGRQMAGAHAFAGMADQRGNHVQQVMFVNTLHVHVHQHGSPGVLISEGEGAQAALGGTAVPAQADQQVHSFHTNDPDFQNCTFSPQGLDFGNKVLSRRYKAQKHALSQHNMIIYTQCGSTAQVLSHALTLYLSHKRAKHAIFLFDYAGIVDELSSRWPSYIHFSEIESLIQQLGPGYEYHRRKIKKERFSLYLYVVKRLGDKFSEQGHRTWNGLLQWADSLKGSSVDKERSDLSSAQVVAQVAGIGLSLVGVL
ncbi:hypothetical protein GOP47_0003160 [Adiantum capillus-veneris]|uniref:DUF7851 domain-containing protein n=1 Tax=Adiantum capillus-veneris TaxID=13818 RepID=A0A9D4VBZ0_ADICA|nr:hypothetical protein GOP47_0003160 [Adiantum capillus-veneris]